MYRIRQVAASPSDICGLLAKICPTLRQGSVHAPARFIRSTHPHRLEVFQDHEARSRRSRVADVRIDFTQRQPPCAESKLSA